MSIKDQLRAAILSGGATGASPSGEAISTFVAPANGYAQMLVGGGGLKALWHSSFGGLCHA